MMEICVVFDLRALREGGDIEGEEGESGIGDVDD
jgi:hypothetical protein